MLVRGPEGNEQHLRDGQERIILFPSQQSAQKRADELNKEEPGKPEFPFEVRAGGKANGFQTLEAAPTGFRLRALEASSAQGWV